MKQTFTSQSECKTNFSSNCQRCQNPSVSDTIPVFGTEEALVEPMLLALDTTVPVLAVSAKKPTKQDS